MKKEKVVNIIGMGWSGKNAPFGDGERWGINCSYVYGTLDRVFWLHKPELIPRSLRFGKDTQLISDVIKKFPDMQIITQDPMLIEKEGDHIFFNKNLEKPQREIIAKTVMYPKYEYGKLMGHNYATSSVMYAVGLAIMEGFDRIRLYGFELFQNIKSNREYEFERQGLEHIIMFAQGKGIKFDIDFNALITAASKTNNNYGYTVTGNEYT